jgi:DNA-binding transcriptional LysR family regulator
MNLLQALGTFIRVTETGSFSAVARESNTNPSSVTRHVGDLEEHFGVRLFQESHQYSRSKYSVVPSSRQSR